MNPLRVTGALCVCAASLSLASSHAHAQATDAAGQSAGASSQRWLDRRVSADERAVFDAMIGYAPPELPASLGWIPTRAGAPDAPPDTGAPTWESLRGRVVVLQAWTNKSAIGRAVAERATSLLRSSDPADVRLLLLHTPDGADSARAYLDRTPLGAPVFVDADGAFSRALGVTRQPFNVVIDRSGAVRYAGLTPEGLGAAVKELAAERFDSSSKPEPRLTPAPAEPAERSEPAPGDAPAPPAATGPAFPPHNPEGEVRARNVQGEKAPALVFGEFVTERADTDGKVVIIDFWATWCGPCLRTIPHMNALAETFKDSVAVIGVSDEAVAKVKSFTVDGSKPKMNYAVATDTQRTLLSWAEPSGIPHVIVISPDGVVRWQGHPGRLTGAIVEQIVKASGAAPAADPATPPADAAPPGKKPAETTRPAAPPREKAPARKPSSTPKLTPTKP